MKTIPSSIVSLQLFSYFVLVVHTEKHLICNFFLTASSLCDKKPNPCDTQTSKCENKDGLFNCICSPGYIPTNYSERICVRKCILETKKVKGLASLGQHCISHTFYSIFRLSNWSASRWIWKMPGVSVKSF